MPASMTVSDNIRLFAYSGFRFSLIEIKALLFMLIRNFVFAEAVPTESVIRKTSIVTRPFVKGEEEAGYQMPVLLRSLA